MLGPFNIATNCCRRRLSIILFYFISIICLNVPTEANQTQQQQHHHNHPNNSNNLYNHSHRLDQEQPTQFPIGNPHHTERILIPNLPPTHYQFWLKNHPRASKVFEDVCHLAGPGLLEIKDLNAFRRLHSNLTFENSRYTSDLDYGKKVLSVICSKIEHVSKSCWGYENNCQMIYLTPECPETDKRHEQMIAWFNQTDFGYILNQRMEMGKYCTPNNNNINPAATKLEDVSLFECTKHFTTCRGNNLFVQFNTSSPVRPLSRVSGLAAAHKKPKVVGEIGGWKCDPQLQRIKANPGRRRRLESWYNELEGYHQSSQNETCDLILDKQVFFVKFGPESSLDNYLSALINLYATIHLNSRFSEDNQIIVWDSQMPQNNTIEMLWHAFSRNSPMNIGQLDGRRVCFRKFVFATPPGSGGLYASKSLIDGCSKSGLYSAFREHIIHRLSVPQLYDLNYHRETQGRVLRVSILSKSSKEFRNILNENELERAIRKHPNTQVLRYNSLDFSHILKSVLNSDIVIGLHDSGLAYSLFLPDWAGLIELQSGNDQYRNLARLRGINYFKPDDGDEQQANFVKKVRVPKSSSQWVSLNQSRLLDNDEFSNYEVDVDKFMKLFNLAKEKVMMVRDDYFNKVGSRTVQPSTIRENGAQTAKTNTRTNPTTTASTVALSSKPVAGKKEHATTRQSHDEL